MPPKRTRAANAAQPVSASQPAPEPQRPTRGGRKRRHSDGSNASEAPSTGQASNTAVKTPAKRRKKGKVTADPEPEVIIEEEDAIDESEAVAPACESAVEVEETIELSQSSKKVHFGQEFEENMNKTTATNITPHPAKMTIKKRRTMSPPQPNSEIKRIKTSRTSLPLSLSQDEDPVTVISEYQFAPLHAVLGRRLTELRMARNGETDDAGPDDMLVLDTQDEFKYPQLPTPRSTPSVNSKRPKTESGSEESSETGTSSQRSSWEAERKKYHDAILALENEAKEAKANLRILTIELESLGFAEEGESSVVILQSIRESFDRVRDFLDLELPGSLPEDATNQDLAEILIANVKEFADRLRTADKELVERGTLNADLGNQVNGLLDHLAKNQVRTQQLEEDLGATQDERDDREEERDAEMEKAQTLETEKTELEKSLDRLTASLEHYQSEEKRLTELINAMEDEHRNTVGKMNKERQETVQELEDQLDTQTEHRSEADQLAEERRLAIVDLEEHLQTTKENREALRQELEDVKAELDEEVEAKESAQANAEDLEARVERLDNEMDEMNEQLQSLREQIEDERTSAQQDIVDRDEQIEELDQKLRQQGKEANELRLKSHELQTQNQQRIRELEVQMSERDAQYQTDMTEEVGRREDADQLASERTAAIRGLETRLEEVEASMRDLIVEKDDRIAWLEDAVSQKDVEIQNLRSNFETAEHAYKAEIDSLKAERDELITDKTSLERRVESEAEQMLEIQNGLGAEIGDLRDKIRDKQEKIGKVEEKARVADAQWEDLLMARNEEIDDLKTETGAREERIVELTSQSERVSKRFRAYVRRSTDTIAHLQEQLRAVTAVAEEEGEELKNEGALALEELEAAGTDGRTVTQSTQKSSKKTRGRKRKVKDSGIGLDDADLEDEGLMI